MASGFTLPEKLSADFCLKSVRGLYGNDPFLKRHLQSITGRSLTNNLQVTEIQRKMLLHSR